MRNGVKYLSPDDAFSGASRGDTPAPTYYDRALLKAPHWDWNVVAYLFLGGIMGSLGSLAILCDERDETDRRLARSLRVATFTLAAVNPALLISHLGRPERFLNMMRIVKLKSPMSVGVWTLVGYSGLAGLSVLLRKPPRVLTLAQGGVGSFVASYTGVLLGATAVPLWGSGSKHIPAFSVCSGMASACALAGMLSALQGNHKATRKLERLEMVAGVAEAALLLDFKSQSGPYGKPMFAGRRGEQIRKVVIGAGIVAPIAINFVGRRLPRPLATASTIVAGALALAGGLMLRRILIEAGKTSANDPRAAQRQPQP